MLLAYWHTRTGTARLAAFADRAAVSQLVAPCVYDPVYNGYGNWGFNTAYAAAQGLDAYLACFDSMAQLERWVAASVPVVISVALENRRASECADRIQRGPPDDRHGL